MSTEHTPGPWRADPIKVGTVNMRTGERSGMRPDGYAITAEEPRKFGGTRIVERGLSEADARLIASAPDLLAALRMIADSDACAINAKAIAASAIAKAVQS